MINALIDGKIEIVDEATLTPNHHTEEDSQGVYEITEWLKDGISVHRSVNATLKNGLGIEAIIAQL